MVKSSKSQPSLFDFNESGLGGASKSKKSVQDTIKKIKKNKNLEKLARAKELVGSPAPTLRTPPETDSIMSVTDLSNRLKSTLKAQFSRFTVQGEICDFKGVHRSGHLYISLKDENSQIRVVMWKGSVQKVPFEIKGGLEVILTGKMDFYSGGGSIQVVAEKMEPVGIGALQLKFEQLKEKLKTEGLFDPIHKKDIKKLNLRVGLITGRSTAALQDMLKVFSMRFPLSELYLFHAAVQGSHAPKEVCSAVNAANEFTINGSHLDVIILARGGGSYEDLFCFNDEDMARSIFQSSVPIVTGIGHEIDVTIADMVSDRRAATPSHAVQEVVPEISNYLQSLAKLKNELEDSVEHIIQQRQQKLDQIHSRLIVASPQKKLLSQKEALQRSQRRLQLSMQQKITLFKAQLQQKAILFDALSPLKLFKKGYSLSKNASGKLVKSIQDVQKGQNIDIQVLDGTIKSQILSTQKQSLSPDE